MGGIEFGPELGAALRIKAEGRAGVAQVFDPGAEVVAGSIPLICTAATRTARDGLVGLAIRAASPVRSRWLS